MPNCAICSENVTQSSTRSRGVQCGQCKLDVHARCANIGDEFIKRIQQGNAVWKCESCLGNKISNSPANDQPDEEQKNASLADIMRILMDLRDRVINIEHFQQFLSGKFEEMNTKINMVTQENNLLKTRLDSIQSKHEYYEYKIGRIEADLDQKNRVDRENNLAIFGLPNDPSNYEKNVNSLFRILQVASNQTNIISINAVKPSKTTMNVKSADLPLVIIKLSSKQIKDDIIKKFRVKKNLFLSELNSSSAPECNKDRKIFVSHHLSPLQSKLYSEAKKLKLKYNLQFLWVQDNNILVRKHSDTKIHRIDSVNDINYLHRLYGGTAGTSG